MAAKREDWKSLPMPAATARLSLERAYSNEEFLRISQGSIPRKMEDKWFIYFDDSWLFFHRSWTGFCIFRARFEHTGEKYVLAEAWVNCDGSQYRGNGDDYDARLLGNLLDRGAGRDTRSR